MGTENGEMGLNLLRKSTAKVKKWLQQKFKALKDRKVQRTKAENSDEESCV